MLSVLKDGDKEEEIDVDKIYNKLIEKMINMMSSLTPSKQ